MLVYQMVYDLYIPFRCHFLDMLKPVFFQFPAVLGRAGGGLQDVSAKFSVPRVTKKTENKTNQYAGMSMGVSN